jgi:hypothetical protein
MAIFAASLKKLKGLQTVGITTNGYWVFPGGKVARA